MEVNMAKKDKGPSAKEFAQLKREVEQLRATVPMDPAQAANYREAMAGEAPEFISEVAAGRNQDVGVSDRMRAMGGRSRSDLADDASRGAGSPLGAGSHSKRRR
jgi:hypothetical protein